jgi:threonine synthase
MRRPSWRICSAAETSVAAAKKLRDYGTIGADGVVVCNLTGHGLKQPEVGHLLETKFTPIAPTLETLRAKIKRVNSSL